MTSETTLPLEHFIKAVQSQLDNAQEAMRMKASNLGLPLTFAIKDIALDLRAHVDFTRSEIRLRPAGPGDKEASVFHMTFTAITKPMIEENTIEFAEDPKDPSLDELKDELSEEERKRLEWSGVRTVSKLRCNTASPMRRGFSAPPTPLMRSTQIARRPRLHAVRQRYRTSPPR